MASKKRKQRSEAEKAADFKRLANKHANTALGAIHRLSQMARPGRYSWKGEQIKALEAAFAEKLGETFARLKTPPSAGGKVTADIL